MIPPIKLSPKRFAALLYSDFPAWFPRAGPDSSVTTLHSLFVPIYIQYNCTQDLSNPTISSFSYPRPLSLYIAQPEYWEKVVVRLLVEGGEHSSTAELVHNHRALRGERETSLCLCSFL